MAWCGNTFREVFWYVLRHVRRHLFRYVCRYLCGHALRDGIAELLAGISLDFSLHIWGNECANIGNVVLVYGGQFRQRGKGVGINTVTEDSFLGCPKPGEGKKFLFTAVERVEVNGGGNAVNRTIAGVLPECPFCPATGKRHGGGGTAVVVGNPEGTFGEFGGVAHLVTPESGGDVNNGLPAGELIEGGEEGSHPYLEGGGA